MLPCLLLLPFALPPLAAARLEDRYDLNMMPFDLRPVSQFIGLWEMERMSGHERDLPPPNLIDFAINPIPKFGARTINITWVPPPLSTSKPPVTPTSTPPSTSSAPTTASCR